MKKTPTPPSPPPPPPLPPPPTQTPTPTPTTTPPPPPPRRGGGAAPAPGAWRGGTCSCPQPWGQARRGVHGEGKVGSGQALRLMLIKLVCLNLKLCGTGRQPVPACRPASRANKKAAAKRMIYINVRTRFSTVCTFYEMSVTVAICTLNMSYIALDIQACTLYVHVYMIQKYESKLMYHSINMYIHV